MEKEGKMLELLRIRQNKYNSISYIELKSRTAIGF